MFYIEGTVKKVDKFWAIEVPFLHVYTQSMISKKDAFRMLQDAIESLAEKKNFFEIMPTKGNKFTILPVGDGLELLNFVIDRITPTTMKIRKEFS